MKAIVAFLVVLVAIAAAQSLSEAQTDVLRQESQALAPENAYNNKVEYVDQLESMPNPALVPKYFVEAAQTQTRRGRRHPAKRARRAVKRARRAVKRARRKAGRKARKVLRKLRRGGRKARRHGRKIHRRGRKMIRKARKMARKAKNALKRKLNRKLKRKLNAKAKGKSIKKMQRKLALKNKKLARKQNKKQAKRNRKLAKRAKKTDLRVKGAMDKLRHLSTSVKGLKSLMTRIDGQVKRLIPENRIRKYVQLDPSKFSNSGYTKTLKGETKKLVNGYKKKQNNEVSYSKQIVDPGLKVIRKDDDMNAQELAMSQKQLSKFTHKLARKDTVSLV